MRYSSLTLLTLTLGPFFASAAPYPYIAHGKPDASSSSWTPVSSAVNSGKPPSMSLKRSTLNDTNAHLCAVKKVNMAHKRHAKRLNGAERNYKRSLEVVHYGQVEWKSVKMVKRDVDGCKDGENTGISARAHKKGRKGRNRGGNAGAGGNNRNSTANANTANSNSSAGKNGTFIQQQFTPAKTPTQADSIALNEDGKDITYFSELTIGSNDKKFTVVMDTGSSDLWVPAIGSTQTHSTLGRGDSDTLLVSQTPFEITYGSGQVAGQLVQDTVKFAGFTLNTTFGASTFVSSDFDNFIPDGILGLATSKASNEGVTVPVEQLAKNGDIPKALFGVHLQRGVDGTNDGVINLGTIDSSFVAGGNGSDSIVFSDNVSEQGLWEAALQDVQVNGKSIKIATASTAIIDTGTTLLFMPPADAMTLHNALSADSQTDGQGFFAIPCDTNTPLTVTFAGQAFDISPKDYVGQELQGAAGSCLSNIAGVAIGGANQSLFGDVFLKNVYSVYDLEKNQVGFGVDAVNAAQ